VARRVLSNSYAFAYFFFGGQLFASEFTVEQNTINQALFEDNQAMLAGEVGGSFLVGGGVLCRGAWAGGWVSQVVCG
jgi:hypothetical protein